MTIWSWGANSYGQLGQRHRDDQLEPLPVRNLPVGHVKSISCGGGHTLVLTESGQLWSCGSNNKGQLGLGSLEDVATLTLVPDLKVTVAIIAGGWDFSLAVTDSGDVYSWGSNAFGQLGDPSLPAKCTKPCRIPMPCKVRQVSAGLRHSVALTESGDVYCWGHAKKGQCGFVDEEGKAVHMCTSPVKVSMPDGVESIVYVVAGSYHTAALTANGQLVIWGCNKHGQVTQAIEVSSQVQLPYLVDQSMFGGGRVVAIRSGWTHLLAQTDNGKIYSWGRCDYGQLGRSRSSGQGHTSTPAPIDLQEKVTQFDCGSEHCLFVTDKQKLYSVGWNEHGLCGTGDEVNVDSAALIPSLQEHSVIYIACGGGHCFTVTDEQCTELKTDSIEKDNG